MPCAHLRICKLFRNLIHRYTGEGFNFARMMGWFKPYDKDDDSGTIWLRDLDQDLSNDEKNRDRIGLCCRKII